jgi:hypothetical protein
MLPSQVREHATTYDIMVLDVDQTWQRYQNNPADVAHYDQQQLLDIMKKNKDGTNK